ncbi:unnamed protein product [Lactuca virosa]|uniref:Uncharacterized protein n=1 Tax=Lactuca virosa TaxID=75947 RepID=A0AAU9P168_9ASTR|nr:unnamed protein product [Lactuca virosa]
MKVQSNSPLRIKWCKSSSRYLNFDELPPSSLDLRVHRPAPSRSTSSNEQMVMKMKAFRRINSVEECVDLRWCKSKMKKVFRKRESHEDEGNGDEDIDGVDLMKRSPSPARRQSQQRDNSKEGEAFVNN